MAARAIQSEHRRSRPKSKSFLKLDLDNAYVRLGVSPLASTEEIASRIADLRGKALKRARAKSRRDFSDADEEEVRRLDKIDEEIGDEKKRKEYDRKYPQNQLLTVQPSAAEQAWLRHRKAGLISAWLVQELDGAALVPSVICQRLWAPAGLEPELLALLERFKLQPGASPATVEPTSPVLPQDLEKIIS
jgi:hypothetical protein